jgi:hypothetical protein
MDFAPGCCVLFGADELPENILKYALYLWGGFISLN